MNTTFKRLDVMIPVAIIAATALLIAGVLYDLEKAPEGVQEETMEERIERYKDFPEKNGSESMFIDTHYTIRSC